MQYAALPEMAPPDIINRCLSSPRTHTPPPLLLDQLPEISPPVIANVLLSTNTPPPKVQTFSLAVVVTKFPEIMPPEIVFVALP